MGRFLGSLGNRALAASCAPAYPCLSWHLAGNQVLSLSLEETNFTTEPSPPTKFEFEMESHVQVKQSPPPSPRYPPEARSCCVERLS